MAYCSCDEQFVVVDKAVDLGARGAGYGAKTSIKLKNQTNSLTNLTSQTRGIYS